MLSAIRWSARSNLFIHRSALVRCLSTNPPTVPHPHVSAFSYVNGDAPLAPVAACEQLIVSVGDLSPFPPWFNIICLGVGVQSLFGLPIMVYSHRLNAKLYRLMTSSQVKETFRPEAMQVKEKVVDGQMSVDTAKSVLEKAWSTKQRQLTIDHNLHPGKRIAALLLVSPAWILIAYSLNCLCSGRHSCGTQSAVDVFSNGGALWFSDLTVPDPYHVLPAILGLSVILAVQYDVWLRKQNAIKPTTRATVLTNVVRLCGILIFCFTSFQPSALPLYWCGSSITGRLYNIILLYPSVRSFFRIPKTSMDSQPLKLSFVMSLFRRRGNA